MSASHKNLIFSPEWRANLSAAHKNLSEETRRKMGEAQRCRWARKHASVPL